MGPGCPHSRTPLSALVTWVTLSGMSSAALAVAVRGLEQALVPPRPGTPLGNWRWSVRQRLGAVREALGAADLGLDTRTLNDLMGRLMKMSSDVLERQDLEGVRMDLRKLVIDVNVHVD